MIDTKIYTPESLGGSDKTHLFCVPGGIGDISWIYSKIKHLKAITGRETIICSAAKDELQRTEQFVQMLPEVRWGGYCYDRTSWQCMSQCFPDDWPDCTGKWSFLHKPYMQNIAANLHLERGEPLSTWMPKLPLDYHYKMNIPEEHIATADAIMDSLTRPIFGVYISNRGKDRQVQGGWNLWDEYEWTYFLKKVITMPQCSSGSFLFMGAEWDRDRTEAVSNEMAGCGCRVETLIGNHLGIALRCLQKCHYSFHYPGGLGILADVFGVPSLMLLPWILKNLETTYADPMNLAYNTYRAWANPSPEEAFNWFKKISMPMAFSWETF